jgi:copper chaperone CopZ
MKIFDMRKINLNVQGISSASCIETIKRALRPLDNVSNIHVDWESGRMQVERPILKSDDLIHAINAAGYKASLDLDEQNP